MRVLLLSDIHANIEALEACLAAAPAFDHVVNLGDVVGYCAAPNEVIDRVRAFDATHVRGNHDKACAGLTSVELFNPIAAISAYWTRDALSPSNKKWLAELPQGPLRYNGLGEVEFVHGSPVDEDDYVISLADAARVGERPGPAITFFGHTHVQGGFAAYQGKVQSLRQAVATDVRTIELDNRIKYFVNPGSVGQPRDGDVRAAFAVYDSDAHTVTYHRVDYDISAAQRRILDANLPERLATRLAEGH